MPMKKYKPEQMVTLLRRIEVEIARQSNLFAHYQRGLTTTSTKPKGSGFKHNEGSMTRGRAVWRKFARKFWQKRPTVLRQLFRSPLFQAEEVFVAIRRAATDDGAPRTVWVDRAYVPSPRDRAHLPSDRDRSFAEYCQRLAPTTELCVVQYGIQRFAPEVWMRARQFLLGVVNVVGLPTKADIDVFYGKYRATPRGPHTDAASNFSFVIEGRKKMLLWPPSYFEEHHVEVIGNGGEGMNDIADSRSYHEFAKDAVVLEGGAGDVLYWPSSYWHMAVSDDLEPTMALNIGLYVGQKTFAILPDIAAFALREILTGRSEPIETYTVRGKAIGGRIQMLPDEYRFLLTTLRSQPLSLAIKKNWLRHLSALAFKTFPPPENNVELVDQDILLGRPECPIVWMPAGGGRLLFAANGACFIRPNARPLVHALAALNNGRGLRLADFIGSAGKRKINPRAARSLREALRLLLAHGAIFVSQDSFDR